MASSKLLIQPEGAIWIVRSLHVALVERAAAPSPASRRFVALRPARGPSAGQKQRTGPGMLDMEVFRRNPQVAGWFIMENPS